MSGSTIFGGRAVRHIAVTTSVKALSTFDLSNALVSRKCKCSLAHRACTWADKQTIIIQRFERRLRHMGASAKRSFTRCPLRRSAPHAELGGFKHCIIHVDFAIHGQDVESQSVASHLGVCLLHLPNAG